MDSRIDSDWKYAAAVVALSVGAALLLLYSARFGLTVSPDSVIYINAAKRLAHEHSYSAFQYGTVAPLTHYPPLFPAVLAVAIKLGFTAEGAALALNVAMYAVTVCSTAIVVQRVSGSRSTALVSAAFTLFAPTVFAAFTKLLSEPLMLPLVTWSLFGFALYARTRSLKTLLWTAVASSFATLARYTGVVLTATAIIVIATSQPSSVLERGRRAVGFVAIACGPLALWLFFGHSRSGNWTNRHIALHIPGRLAVHDLILNVSRWIIPPGPDWPALRGALVIVTGVACVLGVRGLQRQDTLARSFAFAVSTFVVSYSVFILWTMVMVDALTWPNDRILVVALVPLILLCGVIYANTLGLRSRLRRSALAAVTFVFTSWVGACLAWSVRLHRHGDGYASAAWRPTVTALVSSIPPATLIYSNAPEALYYVSGGRIAREIPPPIDPWSRRQRTTYSAELENMTRAVHSDSAVVVYLGMIPRRYVPDLATVAARVGTPLQACGSGIVLLAYRSCR